MQKKFGITYGIDPKEVPPNELCQLRYRMIPFNASHIALVRISGYELITDENDRKVYLLKLSHKDIPFDYQPGDTIGLLPSNNKNEVEKIILRLGLEDVADIYHKLNIDLSSARKKTPLPKHIPPYGTLKNVLLHNVDLCSVPKKSFLRILLNFTEDEEERNKLAVLCSLKSTKEYDIMISSFNQRSLLSLLETFPSCKPPIEILLEYLPPLLPRPYSVSSSPLNEENLSITFNANNEKGVCVSWLEKCIQQYDNTKLCRVPVYLRQSSKLLLPKDDTTPIVMIATGTGISPFRGFLEHRHFQNHRSFGKSWLIYGCRDSSSNYLFKQDLKRYLVSQALTKLSNCFSRENEKNRYVQELIEDFSDEVAFWIAKEGAVVYVCGDFHKVLPGVKTAIFHVLTKYLNSEKEAQIYLEKMVSEGRYITESWN